MNGLWDEFRIAVHSVWQRRWLALAVAWGICLAGWLVVAMIPNTYESKAKVLIDMSGALTDQLGISPSDRMREMERVEQTLTSQANLEKVVRGTALGDNIASQREIDGKVNGLRTSIKILSTQDNLFEISATSAAGNLSDAENAQLSQAIVQKLIDIFREENLGGLGRTAENLKFLDQQLAQRQRELEAAEARRVEFETRNQGLLPGVGSVSDRMAAARLELSQIDTQLAGASSALAAINGQLAGTPPTISTPGFGGPQGGARGALAAAQSELAAARSKGWTDAHPDVIALQSQIAVLRSQAASEPAGGGAYSTPNPAYSSLQSIRAERQANVAALSSRKAALQSDLTAMTARLSSEPGVAAEGERISRDYAVLKDQYDKLFANREAIRLRGQVERDGGSMRFDIIQPPAAPRSPAAPNRPLLLAFVLIAGIGGGVGTAFLLGQLGGSYPTVGKLEAASGMPVLGAISQTLGPVQRALRKKRLRWFVGASGGLVGIFLLLMAVEFIQRGMVA